MGAAISMTARCAVLVLGIALIGGCYSINPDLIDYDGDGVPDVSDAFPADPTEHTDSDDDGVGDNADAYPLDPDRTTAESNPDDDDADDETADNDEDSVDDEGEEPADDDAEEPADSDSSEDEDGGGRR